MMDMNSNLDVTMGSAGHIVVHHGRGINQGVVEWTIWIFKSKDMAFHMGGSRIRVIHLVTS